MRAVIRSLDALLRRQQRIREFSDDPDCLFRIRVCAAPRAFPLEEGEIPAGAPVLELHFWNEQMPRLPELGADIAWGARGRRLLMRSVRALAQHLRDAPDLRSVTAVVGVTAFYSAREAAAGERLVKRLGFACAPYRSPLGRFGEFWENVHARCLLWAFNDGALRRRRPSRLRRVVIWIPAHELVRRYAPPPERT